MSLLPDTKDMITIDYRQISNTHRLPKHKCLSSRLVIVFTQFIEARCHVENEDVGGAAAIWLPTKAQLKLEVWRYLIITW